MKNKLRYLGAFRSVTKVGFVLGVILASGFGAQAISIDWSGRYRFEAYDLDRTNFGEPKGRKSYLTNHLDLSAKVIGSDGINIITRFNVLPNSQYPNSFVGQTMGSGSNANGSNNSSTGSSDSNVMSNTQQSQNLQVTELYLNINQEFGQIVLGRAPLHFGLGITHNAGTGMFDHWYNTHDLVGYKFIIGNFFMMPMIGKIYDYSVAQGRSASETIWHLEYDNPETESAIGIFHQTKTAVLEANDAPTSAIAGAGGIKIGGWNSQSTNIFLSRGFESVKFRIEAGFNSGGTGLRTAAGDDIKLNGYGIATEIEFPAGTGRWDWTLRSGIVSGDNPATANYEGYQFSKNYDVAFLMFNHPMGANGYDILRSNIARTPVSCTTPPCGNAVKEESVDDEVMSNVIYASPKFNYRISDKWDWANTFTWAQLSTNPLASATPSANIEVQKDLGFEWDMSFVYKPTEKIRWVNEVGMLFPGAAWDGGTNAYGKSFGYGLNSKAVISF